MNNTFQPGGIINYKINEIERGEAIIPVLKSYKLSGNDVNRIALSIYYHGESCEYLLFPYYLSKKYKGVLIEKRKKIKYETDRYSFNMNLNNNLFVKNITMIMEFQKTFYKRVNENEKSFYERGKIYENFLF